MALPELSTSTISSVVDGSRNLFSTGITQGLSAQIEALRGRGRVLWAWELDEANDGALSSSREKLLLQCPIAAPANNDTNNTSVRVWSYIAHSSGTHTLRYEVRDLFGALITQGTIGSYSATAWDSDVIAFGSGENERHASGDGRRVVGRAVAPVGARLAEHGGAALPAHAGGSFVRRQHRVANLARCADDG